jgi:hypothetical protein
VATRSARETITTAFRRIGILSEMEAMSADMASDALVILNDMMQGFPARGIHYVHTPLTLDAVLTVPDEQTRNVMLMLMWELADEYGVELSAKKVSDCSEARSALQACYYVVPPAQMDEGIAPRLLPGYGGNAARY